MPLKDIVDELLKAENRSLSWLASELNMTFDGLKLSLLKGSLKYNDMKRMSTILKVQPERFFTEEPGKIIGQPVGEEIPDYHNIKNDLRNCRELVATLKSQVRDKDRIIELLGGIENK